jgi:hypothetical protein
MATRYLFEQLCLVGTPDAKHMLIYGVLETWLTGPDKVIQINILQPFI